LHLGADYCTACRCLSIMKRLLGLKSVIGGIDWFQDSADPVAGTWNEGSGAREAVESAGGGDSSASTQDCGESVPWPSQSSLPVASSTGTGLSDLFICLKMIKWYSSSFETHLQATEHHLPYGITVSPDTGERSLP